MITQKRAIALKDAIENNKTTESTLLSKIKRHPEAAACLLKHIVNIGQVESCVDSANNVVNSTMILSHICWYPSRRSISERLLGAVLRAHPAAATHVDTLGYMALHYLLEFQFHLTVSKLSMVLTANPAATAQATAAICKFRKGWMPLHILLYHQPNATESMVSLVLTANPAAAAHVTPKGWMALHFLLWHLPNATESMVSLVLTANPAAIAHAPPDGWTPLHILLYHQLNATESMVSLVLAALVTANPAAIAYVTQSESTPLHVLMWGCKEANDEQLLLMPAKIRLVLKANPAALSTPDVDGKIPADYLQGTRLDACLAALQAPVVPNVTATSGLANTTEAPLIPDAIMAAPAATTQVNLKARGAHVVLFGLKASRQLNGKRGEVKRPADGEDPNSKATVLLLAEEEGGRTVRVRERCVRAVCANGECPLVETTGAEEAKLLQCPGCKGSSYCGVACQTAAWKSGHKGRCTELRERAARTMARKRADS